MKQNIRILMITLFIVTTLAGCSTSRPSVDTNSPSDNIIQSDNSVADDEQGMQDVTAEDDQEIQGITEVQSPLMVFFDENINEQTLENIREEIYSYKGVTTVQYVSGNEAWEAFQEQYFGDNEELAKGFVDQNPLADSGHFLVYFKEMTKGEYDTIGEAFVSWCMGLEGVRMVNRPNLVN